MLALLALAACDPLVVTDGLELVASSSRLRGEARAGMRHSGRVAGRSAAEIAAKINAHLAQRHAVRPCASFAHAELDALVRVMHPHFDPNLQRAYAAADARLRREHRADYEERWAGEAPLLADPESAEALREAKCAEALMLWAHHVGRSAQQRLDVVLPTLPVFNASAKPELQARSASSFSCVTGHNMQSASASDHQWPHWPQEAHYMAKGHGPYPFWMGAEEGKTPATLEGWWSEVQQSEKIAHSACFLGEAGYSSQAAVPCVHLFVGGQPAPKAYLYTKSEDWCCASEPGSGPSPSPSPSPSPGPSPSPSPSPSSRRLQFKTERLSAPASNWMDGMTYQGEIDFKGDFYTGKAKKYVMTLPDSEPVTYFWYVTTPDGRPVEQGEGGTAAGKSSGKGILLWHDYNTTSFEATTLPNATFAVPSVCQKTTTTCAFP